jgi:hypothetical protein
MPAPLETRSGQMNPRLGSEKPGDTGAADAFPWEAHYPARMDWRATVPQRSLFAILDEAAERFAERPFLDFIGRRYSYAEGQRAVLRLTGALQSLGSTIGGGFALSRRVSAIGRGRLQTASLIRGSKRRNSSVPAFFSHSKTTISEVTISHPAERRRAIASTLSSFAAGACCIGRQKRRPPPACGAPLKPCRQRGFQRGLEVELL